MYPIFPCVQMVPFHVNSALKNSMRHVPTPLVGFTRKVWNVSCVMHGKWVIARASFLTILINGDVNGKRLLLCRYVVQCSVHTYGHRDDMI